MISLQTVAGQGLVVLQNPAFVDQPLLIGGDVAVPGQGRLEGPDRGLRARPYRDFGAVGAPDVDRDRRGRPGRAAALPLPRGGGRPGAAGISSVRAHRGRAAIRPAET